MDGFLIIDKPVDFTSHDVVARLRGILHTKKIGHTGTLDPFATGVLVMVIGKATRLAKFLDKDRKTYEATLRFGFETDTGDLTGKIREETLSPESLNTLDEKRVSGVLLEFTGSIEQTPPMYSAKKVKGQKLYKLARKGIEIARKPIKIEIAELILMGAESGELAYEKVLGEIETREFTIRVECSAGTYIRTLAEDIGRRIGVGCHLSALCRTKVGKFELSRAVSIEELERKAAANEIGSVVIPMNGGISHLRSVILTDAEIEDVGHGKMIRSSEASFSESERIRMIDSENRLIAVGEAHENAINPRIVMV